MKITSNIVIVDGNKVTPRSTVRILERGEVVTKEIGPFSPHQIREEIEKINAALQRAGIQFIVRR